MPDQDLDLDDDLDTDDDTTDAQPNWRRSLERRAAKAAKRAEEAEAKAAAAERRLAFAEAGVKLDDPKAKWFVKGYDGDIDAAAIKAAAAEAGLVESTEPAAQVPADEQQAHERIANTSTGADAPQGRDFRAEMMAAKSPEELHRIAREAGVRFADGAYTPPADN